MSHSNSDDLQLALEVYTSSLRAQPQGIQLDALIQEHPQLEAELRKLDDFIHLTKSFLTSRSFHDSIKAKLGPEVSELTVSLAPDSDDADDIASLETVAPSETSEATQDLSKPASQADPDSTLPKTQYQIHAELGRGGMGVVYKVYDEDLSRTLAMKVLLGPNSGSESSSSKSTNSIQLARFLEEAQVTAQLDHPGIVPVHELGFDAEGQVFFTMKLVRGRELGEIFKLVHQNKENWSLPRAVNLIVQVAQALGYAHSKGVIHRDLKPANIMVGRFGEVFIMDWGLAKIVGRKDLHERDPQNPELSLSTVHSDRHVAGSKLNQQDLVTLEGSIFGTPAFMAPEQAKGLVHEVDQASDLYSLGAILYQLLAGHPPYVEEGAQLSAHTILAQVTQGEPRPIEKVNPQAPPALIAICKKAMQRDKAQRYSSSLEFAEDLQAYLDGRVVHAYESGAIAEFKSWVKRNKSTAFATATAAMIIAIGVVAGFFLQLEANRKISLEKDHARKEVYFSNIALAAKSLEESEVSKAFDLLKTSPVEHRGWEWGQLVFECRQYFQDIPITRTVVDASINNKNTRAVLVFKNGPMWIWDLVNEKRIADYGTFRNQVIAHGINDLSNELVFLQVNTNRKTTLSIVDLETGEKKERTLESPKGLPGNVVINPVKEEFGCIVGAKKFTVWDLKTDKIKHELQGHINMISAEFTLDGKRIITRGNLVCRVWNAETGEHLYAANIPISKYKPNLLSPDGSVYSLIEEDGQVGIYDAKTAELRYKVKGQPGKIVSVIYRPDSKALATINSEGSLRGYHIESGEEWMSFDQIFKSVSASRDYSIVVGTFNDRVAQVFDGNTGEIIQKLRGHDSNVLKVVMSPNGGMALTVDDTNKCKAWIIRKNPHALDGFGGVLSMSLSPNRDRLATGHWDNSVRVWDIKTRQVIYKYNRFFQKVNTITFSPDGQWIAAAGGDQVVEVFSASDGKPWRSLKGAKRLITSLAFSKDGNLLYSGDLHGDVKVWDWKNGSLIETLNENLNGISDIEIHPNGQKMALSDVNGNVEVKNLIDGSNILTLDGSRSKTLDLKFHPSEDLIAIARSKEVHLIELSTGNVLQKLKTRSMVQGLTFSPNGTRIVTASGEPDINLGYPTASVWDVVSGRELLTFKEDHGAFNSIAFLPDGNLLISNLIGDLKFVEALPYKDSLVEAQTQEQTEYWANDVSKEYWKTLAVSKKEPGLSKPPKTIAFTRDLWPERLPTTPDDCIDLSPYYNGILSRQWHAQQNAYSDGNDLSTLPIGYRVLQSTPFDIRGVLQVSNQMEIWQKVFPETIKGIAIHSKVIRLHLLLGMAFASDNGENTSQLIFNYNDGTTAQVNLIAGVHAKDWHKTSVQSKPVIKGMVAWEGSNRFTKRYVNRSLNIFRTFIENPNPEKVVKSIDFKGGHLSVAPFIIAMTKDNEEDANDFHLNALNNLISRYLTSPSLDLKRDLSSSLEARGLYNELNRNTDLAEAYYHVAFIVNSADDSEDGKARSKRLKNKISKSPTYAPEEISIISKEGDWKYYYEHNPPSSDWLKSNFDDNSWKEGKAMLGFGEKNHVTEIEFGDDPEQKPITAYFRKSIDWTHEGKLWIGKLNHYIDDGLVFYLNGEELVRFNLPLGEIQYSTLTSNSAEAIWRNDELLIRNPPQGRIVFAAEVHQRMAKSSDLAFDLELKVIKVQLDKEKYSKVFEMNQLSNLVKLIEALEGN